MLLESHRRRWQRALRPTGDRLSLPRVNIGRQSAGFIRRGHPWLLPDRFTSGLDGLAPGTPVLLVDERGAMVAPALADPGAAVAARVYAKDPHAAFVPADAVRRAWQRRGRFHHDRSTDCYRIVHGEADGLPGLRVERYADVVVVLVQAACATPHVPAVCAALNELLPAARIVIRDHLDDLRREEVTTRSWYGSAIDPEAVVEAREFGLHIPLRPFAGLATGIYVDQRGTRRWLRQRCANWRILNLFAYTGIFSCSLLHAGAAQATDVDLAAPSLARASETATRNGLSDRHRIVHADCNDFLAGTEDFYDLILIDPPTAAQGGTGWIAKRDYPRLLELAVPRLAPGGRLLACSNTLGGKTLDLAELVRAAGATSDPAPGPMLDPDLPQMHGFPEGLPFQIVVAQR